CQAILAAMDGDLLPLLDAAARGGTLPAVGASARAAVCVVLASGGYPDHYATGLLIDGIADAERAPGVGVFHAGTAQREGRLVTSGGRVLGVTATETSVANAIDGAYTAAVRIRFEGMHYRRDIGRRTAAHETTSPQERRP